MSPKKKRKVEPSAAREIPEDAGKVVGKEGSCGLGVGVRAKKSLLA